MNETFETENEDVFDLVRHYSKRINFYLPPQPFKERYRVSHERARLLIQKMSPYYEVKGNRNSNITIDQKILRSSMPGIKWSDTRVLRKSSLFKRFEVEQYRPFPNAVLLGDSIYPALDVQCYDSPVATGSGLLIIVFSKRGFS